MHGATLSRMKSVTPWRPGMTFSEDAIMALRRQARRGDIPPKEAAVYLRAALREAERVGDTESIVRTIPMLAIMCHASGASAEGICLHRRHRWIEQTPDSVDFLIVMLSFKGFVRAALRVERQVMGLGLSRTERARNLQTATNRSLLPIGPRLSIHHDGKRARARIPHSDGTVLIVHERGRQGPAVQPYTIRWHGEGNDLLNTRRWRLDVHTASADRVAFLDLARRLARRMNGVLFEPTNKILWAAASRFFVPQDDFSSSISMSSR